MKTIKQDTSSEITEKKSKFISDIFYVETVEEAEKKIEQVRKKYHDAKHHCFTYRILEQNNEISENQVEQNEILNQNRDKMLENEKTKTAYKIIERASDDGEPSGTAGGPMLNLLAKNDLCNIVVIVTRYFGGILLGTGGLVRAYTKALEASLNNTEIIDLVQGEILKIPVSYQTIAYLQYYCKKNNISILQTNFDEEPYVIIEMERTGKDKMLQELKKRKLEIEKITVVKRKYLK